MMRFKSEWLLLLWLVWAVTGHAEVVLAVEGQSMRYQSTERNAQGRVINQETGSLAGTQVRAHWQQGHWWVELDGLAAQNTIAYDGFTQIGLPLQTLTRLQFSQWGGRAGRYWQINPHSRLGLSLGVAQLRVDRNILPGLGSLPLQETLDTTHAVLGAQWQQQLDARTPGGLRLILGLDWLPALSSQIAVNSFGQYDAITLQPGLSQDYRARLRLEAGLGEHVNGWVSWAYQSYQPGASSTEIWRRNGTPAASVRYPGSQQSLNSVGAGLSWTF